MTNTTKRARARMRDEVNYFDHEKLDVYQAAPVADRFVPIH